MNDGGEVGLLVLVTDVAEITSGVAMQKHPSADEHVWAIRLVEQLHGGWRCKNAASVEKLGCWFVSIRRGVAVLVDLGGAFNVYWFHGVVLV